MNIDLETEITKEDADHLFNWQEDVFPVEGKSLTWAKPKWHIVARDLNQKPLAHLGYGDFKVTIDGDLQKIVIGVGSVVVRPEEQGRNVPAKLFDFLHNSPHAKNFSDIFTLFCPHRLVSYYEQHGYKAFNGSLKFLQNETLSSSNDFVFMYKGLKIIPNTIKVQGEPW